MPTMKSKTQPAWRGWRKENDEVALSELREAASKYINRVVIPNGDYILKLTFQHRDGEYPHYPYMSEYPTIEEVKDGAATEETPEGEVSGSDGIGDIPPIIFRSYPRCLHYCSCGRELTSAEIAKNPHILEESPNVTINIFSQEKHGV